MCLKSLKPLVSGGFRSQLLIAQLFDYSLKAFVYTVYTHVATTEEFLQSTKLRTFYDNHTS